MRGLHLRNKSCGDVWNRVQISCDLNVSLPFAPLWHDNGADIENGIEVDVKDYRRMVSNLFKCRMRDFKDIPVDLRFFFSLIFLDKGTIKELSFHQFNHPVFFERK